MEAEQRSVDPQAEINEQLNYNSRIIFVDRQCFENPESQTVVALNEIPMPGFRALCEALSSHVLMKALKVIYRSESNVIGIGIIWNFVEDRGQREEFRELRQTAITEFREKQEAEVNDMYYQIGENDCNLAFNDFPHVGDPDAIDVGSFIFVN